MIMKINRAYQFRLYPNEEQIALIHKTFGCTRFVYNYCLDLKRNNKYLTKFDLIKELPKKMLENKNNHKHLRKEIASATFSEIIRILKYKCNWLNKIFIQVNPYYASSQICSKCGVEIERDYNASLNILHEGLKCYNN